MRYLFFSLIFFASLQPLFSQTVTVEVPTDKKIIAEILKQSREETAANKLYFAEADKCRKLVRTGSFAAAEASCRLAVSYAGRLPKDRYLERSSAYEALAYALLRQRKADEAILLLNKSLEAGKPVIDDTDAETGERYFLLGQSYHQLGKVNEAKDFYIKAERVYRTAITKICGTDSDGDEICSPYPRAIANILEAHLILLRSAELHREAFEIEKRLIDLKAEFSKNLEN